MKRHNGKRSTWFAGFSMLLCVALFGCAVPQPLVLPASRDAERSRELRSVIEAAAKDGRFSGEALISQHGRIIFRHRTGFASYELEAPFSAETRFKIFSTTKHFTAAAIMLLERDGRLHIEDPISSHMPEAPVQWRSVTLWHLLTHTSGIQLGESDLASHQRPTQSDSVVAAMRACPNKELKFVPGERFEYSNAGYTLLGAVVERVSGQSYAEFLHKRIFVPAGMVHSEVETGVFDPEHPDDDLGAAVTRNLASGYRGSPGRLTPTTSNVYVIAGAGGMYSTPEDIWRYDNALREARVLSAEQQQRMVANSFRTPGSAAIGLGWFIRQRHGRQMLSHSGGNNGFAVEYARIPSEDLCVVIFTNIGFANPEELRDQLLDVLLAGS